MTFGFLGSRPMFTHHFTLCHSSYPTHILLPVFFNNVSQCPEREETMEEVILKPLRSKAPQGETRMSISLWILGGAVDYSGSCRAGRCSQSRGNVPGWISRHGSHCPPLKAGFSKHTWTGDRSQMGASRRRGRRRKVPCLASGGRGSVTPPPNQSGFPCAGLTRGSW